MSLIAELKRRNVFRVGAAYAIVGWLLIEVASVVLPTFEAPEWVMKVLTFLVILGFPLTLVIAWAFELTPEGIKREQSADRAESITQKTSRKLDHAIIGLLVLAVVFLVVDNYVLEPEGAEVTAEQIPAAQPIAQNKSIAVLPFANRSANEADAFFVDGVHDDILSHISKIAALKVISRTSVMRYRDTTKSLKTIGEELGVTTILEGGVQRAGDRIRLNVQLIDASTDEHVWVDTYDRELTVSNIFAIQTEIATAVADALRATLTAEERDRLAIIPTENLAAYEAYMLGRQRMAKRTSAALTEAGEYFQRAVELDPEFALAYVGLSDSYQLLVEHGGLGGAATMAKARAAVDRALELDDVLGEAYNSLAGVLWWEGGVEDAEAAFRRALELSPNYATAYHWYGLFLRFHSGEFEEALDLHRRAAQLDPLSPMIIANVAYALEELGRFEKSLSWLKRSVEVDPGFAYGHMSIGGHLYVLGRLDEALVWLGKSLALDPESPDVHAYMSDVFLDLGALDEAEYLAHRSHELGPETFASLASMQFVSRYTDDQAGAIEYGRKLSATNRYLWQGDDVVLLLRDHELRAGRPSEARALYETAYPELLSEDGPKVGYPNYRPAINFALVLLATGEQERAEELLDRSLERIQSPTGRGLAGYQIADVQIHALRGERQKALAALRRAIDEGWRGRWWYFLKHDPNLESLHDEPEFQAMVAEFDAYLAAQLARVRDMELNGELEPIPEVSATTQ
jgi:TolB-like protein/Tfp pilus assembly protein PilF